MPNPSQFDVIKPEVRGLAAYTLKHFDADVKLDQNENPYELPADLKREVVDRVPFDVDKLLEAARTADVVVVCTPNNPTGNLLEREALVALLKTAKGLVLVDEAYHEFSGQTAFPLLAGHRNLVVLRTFSKAMAMAGLRFGYMMAHPEIAREVHKSKLPYNVNVFTLAAAELVI